MCQCSGTKGTITMRRLYTILKCTIKLASARESLWTSMNTCPLKHTQKFKNNKINKTLRKKKTASLFNVEVYLHICSNRQMFECWKCKNIYFSKLDRTILSRTNLSQNKNILCNISPGWEVRVSKPSEFKFVKWMPKSLWNIMLLI